MDFEAADQAVIMSFSVVSFHCRIPEQGMCSHVLQPGAAQKSLSLCDCKNYKSCLKKKCEVSGIFSMQLSPGHGWVQKVDDSKAQQCLFCMTFPIIKLNALITDLLNDLTGF